MAPRGGGAGGRGTPSQRAPAAGRLLRVLLRVPAPRSRGLAPSCRSRCPHTPRCSPSRGGARGLRAEQDGRALGGRRRAADALHAEGARCLLPCSPLAAVLALPALPRLQPSKHAATLLLGSPTSPNSMPPTPQVLEAEAKASGGKLQARHMFKRTAGKDGSFQVSGCLCAQLRTATCLASVIRFSHLARLAGCNWRSTLVVLITEPCVETLNTRAHPR